MKKRSACWIFLLKLEFAPGRSARLGRRVTAIHRISASPRSRAIRISWIPARWFAPACCLPLRCNRWQISVSTGLISERSTGSSFLCCFPPMKRGNAIPVAPSPTAIFRRSSSEHAEWLGRIQLVLGAERSFRRQAMVGMAGGCSFVRHRETFLFVRGSGRASRSLRVHSVSVFRPMGAVPRARGRHLTSRSSVTRRSSRRSIALTSGPIRNCFNSIRRPPSHVCCRRASGLFFGGRPALGQSALRLAGARGGWLCVVDRAPAGKFRALRYCAHRSFSWLRCLLVHSRRRAERTDR